jgi:hypothetical protein
MPRRSGAGRPDEEVASVARPLVSVLIPTYNGERFLDEALLSVRRQTYRNLEILVRDDGSTDGTLEIARQNASEDSRITVIESDHNAGGRANYISLAKLATGEFIKYCNQDDLLHASCVDTLLTAFKANPDVTLATSSRVLIDADGKELPATAYSTPLVQHDAILDGQQIVRYVMLNSINQIGEPTTAMYRNGLVDPDQMFCFGGRQARLNGDVALWLNLLSQGDLSFTHKPQSSFRIHEGQISTSVRARVYGSLEWAYLLEIGLNEGYVSGKDYLERVGAMIGLLLNAAHQAAISKDPQVDGVVDEAADLAARLMRLVSKAAE